MSVWNLKACLAGVVALLAVSAWQLGFELCVTQMSVEEKIVSSTVMLENDGGGASGVLIRREGRWYCWTAAHVEKAGVSKVTARVFDQGRIDARVSGRVVRTVAVDPVLDLALLEVSLLGEGPRGATLGRKTLALGQEVINCGHSHLHGFPWNVVRGHVSQVPGESDAGLLLNGNYLASSVSSYPGCSGSGIWTTDGKLVGILSWGGGPGLLGFVHSEVMVRFAQEKNVKWAL